jgi:hypothetical protein
MNIKPLVRRPQSTSPRYEVRFVNGVWTIFDRFNFGHGNPLGTRKEADRVAADLNEGKLKWAA